MPQMTHLAIASDENIKNYEKKKHFNDEQQCRLYANSFYFSCFD